MIMILITSINFPLCYLIVQINFIFSAEGQLCCLWTLQTNFDFGYCVNWMNYFLIEQAHKRDTPEGASLATCP